MTSTPPSEPRDAGFTLSPIKTRRTFETVIERIVDGIDSAGLRSGERLPNEGDLADMLAVSRPTLRQALRILEFSGILTIKAGQQGGVFVATDILPVDALEQQISQEVDHVSELLATRRLLEPVVAHMTAENATVDELDGIGAAITLMQKHIDDPRIVAKADAMFHRRVAHASGNQIMRRTMNEIYRQLIPLQAAMHNTDEKGALHMIDVHARQLAALRAKDHDQLDRLLQESFIDLENEWSVHPRYGLRWTRLEP